jgi:hypothetical protein
VKTARSALLLGLALALLSDTARANDATGAWSPVFDWPIIPVHVVLMPDGKVMSFGTSSTGVQGGELHYAVWNPALGTAAAAHELLPNVTPTDLFCAAQVLSPTSGKALLFGGDNNVPATNWGNPNATAFDGQSSVLSDLGFAMAYPRWYATATTLPNGDMLIQGGSNNGVEGTGMLTPELFHPARGFRSLFGATSEFAYGDDFNRWWYPRAFVLDDGRVFNISGPAMYFVDVAGDGSLTEAGTFDGTNLGATSTAVMFAPGRILQAGGGMAANGNPPGSPLGSKSASIIDVTSGTPVVTPTSPMQFSRHWSTGTLLPDGSVLVTGGSPENAALGGGASLTPELWKPATGKWTALAPEANARLYHSVALLMPDGRVLSGGGGAPGPVANLNAQLFSPPYLFEGANPAARPDLTVANTQLGYGGTLAATLAAEPRAIARVTLLKTGAVTHSFNNEQRFLELAFTRAGNQLSIQLPASPNQATPGYYLLFVLDSAGVPSVGRVVRLLPQGAGTPVDLVADGGFESKPVPAGGWVNYTTGQSLGSWSVSAGTVSVQSNTHRNLGTRGASGAQHVDLNGPPRGEISQTLNGLTSGATYALTFKYAIHDFAGGSAGAQVRVGDLDHRWTATNLGSSNWIQAAQRFTASAASMPLTFRGTAGAECCGMLIDDVTVVQVSPAPPEPVLAVYPWTGGTGSVGFNGVNSNVQYPHAAGYAMTNQLTLAARVFVNAFGNWDGIITKGINNSPYALQLWGNGLRFTANWGGPAGGVGGGSWDSTLPMAAGQWHHVAVTYDGARIRFYVDGELDPYQPAANLTFGTNTEAMVLGADFPGGDEYFDGRMADVRVYNKGLSADQVRALAATRAPAGTTPIASWSPWNGGAGAVSFNGTTDVVNIAPAANQSTRRAVTLAARVYVDVFGDWDGILTKGTSVSPYALQLTATGQLRFSANWGPPANYYNQGSWDSSVKLAPGRWYHVAVTYDGVTIRFYVDGQLTPYQPAANLVFGTVTEPLTIGADLPGGDEYFDGQLSDAKLFDQALTADQVRALAVP